MVEKKILVVGGTGYVGTRLVEHLLQHGYNVRVTFQSFDKIKIKLWYTHPNLETVPANAFHRQSLIDSCKGCSTVFYLVHCMFPSQDKLMISDKIAAENMVDAVNQSDIDNIIYLGGLGGNLKNASTHQRSRVKVGKILRSSKAPVTILQAAMIIGSGSASFEILRYLVERLPIMIIPKWVGYNIQPVAIRNVIEYLVRCVRNPDTIGKTFDIGGPTILSYRKLMEAYAVEADLKKRLVIPLPFNDPLQSSIYFVNAIVPIEISIIKPMIEGLKNEVICSNDDIKTIIPQELLTPGEAIRRSIAEVKQVLLHDNFQLAGWAPPPEFSYFGDPIWSGGSILYDRWTAVLKGNLNEIWNTIQSIGGSNGWPSANLLWRTRGYLDEFLGGPGMRRGRNHPTELKRGEILDCWRVTRIEENSELLLTAEMKLPGIASLNFKLKDIGDNKIILDQIACFIPKGIWGLVYWQLVLPFHVYVFTSMIKGIAKKSNAKIIYGPKYLKRNTRT